LRISSRIRIGALRYNTAFHSSHLSGAMENTSCSGGQKGKKKRRAGGLLAVKNGMYMIPQCNIMLRTTEATSDGFFHTGNLNKLSFSDSEFMALNISTVTRIERLMVAAVLDISFANISQPTSGKREEHW
jgi:hypothetical protein